MQDEDITEAATAMAGQIPAVIREIVERAKLYCVDRSTETTEVLLTNKDLVEATKVISEWEKKEALEGRR